jgi:hypothetical protein
LLSCLQSPRAGATRTSSITKARHTKWNSAASSIGASTAPTSLISCPPLGTASSDQGPAWKSFPQWMDQHAGLKPSSAGRLPVQRRTPPKRGWKLFSGRKNTQEETLPILPVVVRPSSADGLVYRTRVSLVWLNITALWVSVLSCQSPTRDAATRGRHFERGRAGSVPVMARGRTRGYGQDGRAFAGLLPRPAVPCRPPTLSKSELRPPGGPSAAFVAALVLWIGARPCGSDRAGRRRIYARLAPLCSIPVILLVSTS